MTGDALNPVQRHGVIWKMPCSYTATQWETSLNVLQCNRQVKFTGCSKVVRLTSNSKTTNSPLHGTSYAEPSLQFDECFVEGGFVWCHYLQQDIMSICLYFTSKIKNCLIDRIFKRHLQSRLRSNLTRHRFTDGSLMRSRTCVARPITID